MGIFEAHQVHQPLHRAVLAGRAVQRVEHHVGRGLEQPLGDVAAHVDPRDAMAAALQRVGDARAGDERDLPLGRPAAHQHRDV